MKKQLIIKAPEGTTFEEVGIIGKVVNEHFAYNYPIVLPYGYEYEVIEINEPFMSVTVGGNCEESKRNTFLNAIEQMNKNRGE